MWTASLSLSVLMGLGACGTQSSEPPVPDLSSETHFEDGWNGWEPDTALLSSGPAEQQDVRFEIKDEFSGRCAGFFIREAPAMFWIERAFDVDPGTYRADVSWRTRSVSQGSELQALAYVGAANPEPADTRDSVLVVVPGLIEADADLLGNPVHLDFENTISVEPDDSLWVAVGYWSTVDGATGGCVDDVVVEAFREDEG